LFLQDGQFALFGRVAVRGLKSRHQFPVHEFRALRPAVAERSHQVSPDAVTYAVSPGDQSSPNRRVSAASAWTEAIWLTARVLVVGRRIWRASLPVVPVERDVCDLVVVVQLHAPVTRGVLIPRRGDQISHAELSRLLAARPRDMTAGALIADFALEIRERRVI